MMSEPEISIPKRLAWPVGLLLSIVQMILVWTLMTIFGQYENAILSVALLLYMGELIVGLVCRQGGSFAFQGRVLVFTALFPVALLAVILLVWSGVCIFQGKGIGR